MWFMRELTRGIHPDLYRFTFSTNLCSMVQVCPSAHSPYTFVFRLQNALNDLNGNRLHMSTYKLSQHADRYISPLHDSAKSKVGRI